MTEKNNKIYLTTPIYYVNSVAHLGHAYTTLAIDVLTRYYRELGKDVFFLTGTDEHGAKIFEAAQKAGKTPQGFCDEVSSLFKKAWGNLNIGYSYFIRTTDKNHEEKVAEFLTILKDKGFLYEGEYAGKYCVGCEKFVTEKDLVDGKCPDHKCEPQDVAEENWFFKLRQLLPKIQELIESDKILIRPENAKSEVLGVIKQGIDDISISRKNVSWGIKLPWDESQTIYVWVDALLNYWTVLQNFNKTEFWPADLHLVGRDILKFHCIMWPALLLAYYKEGAIDQLPKQIFCHGYFTIDGQKMSKTIGNVIDPNNLIKKYGIDATRYLLLTQFPFGNDGDVSLGRLDEKYNSDLASGLGNLTARVITLARKSNIKNQTSKIKIKSQKVKQAILEAKNKHNFSLALENLKIDEALGAVWELIGACDKIIDTEKPWEVTDQKSKIKNQKVIEDLLLALQEIAELLKPFMPQTAEKITGQIKTGKSEPLFPRLNF
ncbi:MAG: methionine--tRNA ligase [Candidatus Pacebacteria bacterium]|nr:methionine--tRNA ligase [Candidatus Paceibacterota bacterium]